MKNISYQSLAPTHTSESAEDFRRRGWKFPYINKCQGSAENQCFQKKSWQRFEVLTGKKAQNIKFVIQTFAQGCIGAKYSAVCIQLVTTEIESCPPADPA